MVMRKKEQERKDGFAEEGFQIRSCSKADEAGVQRVCFAHFRSLTLSAVWYYITQHIKDLAFLVFVSFFFTPFWGVLSIAGLFLVYLYLRARYEMENYITQSCPDLFRLGEMYLDDKDSHFWVATLTKDGVESVVGCVGVAPYRDELKIAQMVRLVVPRSFRRMRIGSRLLSTVELFSKEHGFNEVRLYTNNLTTGHMKFVRQHGFELIEGIRRGFMRGDLYQWRKKLMTEEPIEDGKIGLRPRASTLGLVD